MAMLRMLGRDLHSNYGPTADTGGLMLDHAPDDLRLFEPRRAVRGGRTRRSEGDAAGPGWKGRHRAAGIR